MTNKLIMNDDVKTFLDTEEKHLWDLILDDKITDLLASLSQENEEGDLREILKELFSSGDSESLTSYDFSILEEGSSHLFKDLVRLIFVLDINGNHEGIRQKAADKLFDSMPQVVESIQSLAKPISEEVWIESTGMRTAMNNLIHYYRLKDNIDALHFIVVIRTKITYTILSQYKFLVGPDIIESAQIKEKVGEIDTAKEFYNMIKSNFKNELDWFIESPEAGPSEEDVVTLKSLREAYATIDRLGNADEHTEKCALIDDILNREYIDIWDDEEDDE